MTFFPFFSMKEDNKHILFATLMSFHDSLRTNFVMNRADFFLFHLENNLIYIACVRIKLPAKDDDEQMRGLFYNFIQSITI